MGFPTVITGERINPINKNYLANIIKKFMIKIPKVSPEASLNDERSNFKKIKDKLSKNFNITIEKIDSEVLKRLSEILRKKTREIAIIVKDKEIIHVGLKSEIKNIYGITIDLGTTKIAIYLMDLETGKTVDVVGIMNPQIAYGEDVISRLQYCMEKQEGSKKLKNIALKKINKEINNICIKNKIIPKQIMEAVVVGNTAMHHIFLGLSIKQLALSPFKPAISDKVQLKARKLGLAINRCGYVYFPSPIAGFVGSDHLAMILSSKIFEKEGNVLGIDIGTNTEIALKTDDVITCCSTASGPAFEGANIEYGMRASQGAIDAVVIEKDSLNVMISTIDNYPPIGICGSGILDCIAEMLKTKIIDSSGKIIRGKKGVRIGIDGKLEYILTKKSFNNEGVIKTEREGEKEMGIGIQGKDLKEYEEVDYITVTQNDIREIKLAKGAIRAGIDILLKNANLGVKDIDKVIIAGAFGTYLDIKSSIEIGMFPRLSINRFHQIGNAAGIGAKQILTSKL